MENLDILEFNKLCISFLGFQRGWWISQEKPLTEDKRQWWDIEGKTFLGTRVYYDHQLLFHEDWNWIMLIIEKINSLPLTEKTHTVYNLKMRENKDRILDSIYHFLKNHN